MHHFQNKKESGHDHFFSTFIKFYAISLAHGGQILAETVNRAGLQNESYMEIMLNLDNNASAKLGQRLGWDSNFARMRKRLLAHNLPKIVTNMRISLDQIENTKNQILGCQTEEAKAGCQVKVRYLHQALREFPPEMVFAQLLAGFEAANQDRRFVGINIVQPEDGKIAMRDYSLQMKMVGYLHQLYPKVAISLHAGELNQTLVGKNGLKFHINQAVNLAKAKRIGHGVAIRTEENVEQLLQKMAEKGILVEINLSSNAETLQVGKKNHPLPFYLQHGVPLSLSTDDEGINRSNLTKEYQKAVEAFNLNYATLKTFARNSLSYSFLPGKKLWEDSNYLQLQAPCREDKLGSTKPSKACKTFLKSSEKAAMQWNLEQRFNYFEQTYRNL